MEVEGPFIVWLRSLITVCITASCFSLGPEPPMGYMIKLGPDTKGRQQHAFATGFSPNRGPSLAGIAQSCCASSTNSDGRCTLVPCHLNASNAWVWLCCYHKKKRRVRWSYSATKENLLTFDISNGTSIALFSL